MIFDKHQLNIRNYLLTTLFTFVLFFSTFSITYADITTGLVGHWKFDEGAGTTAFDSSGNENTGALVNNPTWTTGKIGGALSFDGVNDYVQMPIDALKITSSMSFGGWFKPDGTGSNNGLALSWDSGSAGPYGIKFDQNGTEKIEVITWTTDNGYISVNNIQNVDNKWYHVLGVIDLESGLFSLYINGAFVSSTPITGEIYYSGYGSRQLQFGRDPDQDYYNGTIDDIRIYNRALTQADIIELYNNTGGNVEPPPTQQTCSSFTYSNWSPTTCPSSGTQTRTVISSLPNGCTGGTPTLTQSCTYTTPPSTNTSWQGILDTNFDFAETFDLIADWRGVGYGNVFFKGPNARWDFFSEWDNNPDTNSKWIASHGTANVWGGSGKSLKMDLSYGSSSGGTPNTGPSRFGRYFGTGTPDSGYDEMYLFSMVKMPDNYFPLDANGDWAWMSYYKWLPTVSTGFENVGQYDSNVTGLTNQGQTYGMDYFVAGLNAWNYGSPCTPLDKSNNLRMQIRFDTDFGGPNFIEEDVKFDYCLDKYIGDWFGVEYYLKTGTPGQANGHITVWVYDKNGNATRFFDQDRMMLAAGHNYKYNKFFMGGNLLWSGSDISNLDPNYYIDDIILDDQRIGPKYFSLLNGATPPTQTLQGDLNFDNTVNTLDWSIMNTHWGTSNTQADLNNDGVVNTIDFSILNSNWNS